MKISHEVPLSLLSASREFNDYDYALVHLFEENTEYLNFFKESLSQGRKVILDNSVFELETAFDPERFAYWINELKPTEYIIPDVLDDATATLASANDWLSKYSDLPGIKIGVVQGESLQDAVECYTQLYDMVDKIAISFNCKFYEELFHSYYDDNGNPKILDYDMIGTPITALTQHGTREKHLLMEWMWGRQKFLERIARFRSKKPVHLLGCSLPQEFKAYTDAKYDFIDTVDTSNPIVHAINGIRYEQGVGLYSKVSTKLVEYLNQNVALSDDMSYNINEFKSYCNGTNQ